MKKIILLINNERRRWKISRSRQGCDQLPGHFRVGLSRASAVPESLQAEDQRASGIVR